MHSTQIRRLARTASFVGALGLLLCAPISAASQGVQTGTVRGAVTDTQDLPLPGVTVTVSSPSLQGQRTVVTETDGTYVLRLLPAGEYTITFELAAFTTAKLGTTIPLGGVVEQNVTLQASGITEQVTVIAETPAALAVPSIGLNITQDEVEALATSRTLQGIATLSPGVNDNSPNAGQLVINGAFAFDNTFMLNGVDVTDNLFGSPQSLFIEDAIEETQVLTSGISAEYGRFSGGVVNAVTKSGGNTFSGSLRLNLTNPAWTRETPYEEENGIERESNVNRTWEGTFGGPILRDRVWFFGAGRRASLATSNTFNQTGIPYGEEDNNWRAEGKVTVTPWANQTFQGGYLNNHREISNTPSFGFSIDPLTLSTQKLPNWYVFGNYRGVVRSNLLFEAQVSERRYKFDGVGGTSTAIADSPFITLTQDLGHYNAPYFDATDPEERNNRQLNANMTYFLEGRGRHEIKGGYEWYRSQNTGGNSQSATSFVFDADYATDAAGNALQDASGRLIPVFVPGETQLENWLAVRGAKLNVDTQSFYAQDHWTISRQLSADLGLRYERVRSEATGGIVGVDTDTVVPRLALSFDPLADGRVVFHTTYGHYAGRYNEAQIGGNTNVGNPDVTVGIYDGPGGQGLDFAPGLNPANYDIVVGEFPTANVFFEEGLSSPTTREFTVSGGGSVGQRAYGEATYVWRKTYNLIEDFIELGNGVTDVTRDGIEFGTFTNIVYRNNDLPTRRYQAFILQGRYRVRGNWTANAAWTIQLKNEGNYEGENANQPGATGLIGDFPEAFSAERNFPIGRLQSAQRHRARLWTIYEFGAGRLGGLSLSGLWRIESGQVYSLAATGVPLTPIQEALLAGYPDAPADQTLYFGERGSETYPGYGAVDVSVNYNVPVFRTLRPWVKLDFFNVLNNTEAIGFNTSIRPDPNSPLDALGLPTGYVRGASFGQPQATSDFPVAIAANGGGRAFRIAFGFRF